MNRLYPKNWAICKSEILPTAYKKMWESRLKILQNTKETLKIAKDFFIFAKLTKFRQMWSHW